MEAFVVAPAGFLLAVLWFDLMFDTQIRPTPPPDGAVASISRYYRRVTTDAAPMNYLVAFAMLATAAAIVVQLATGAPWNAWVSLPLALAPMTLARVRTVPNAVRLGTGTDPPDRQLAIARIILHDHVACFIAISGVIAVQLVAAA